MSVTAWTWEPTILLAIAVTAFLYARGCWHLRRLHHGVVPTWRVAAFVAGLAVICLALLSPIDTYDDSLFTLHMLQHMLLVLGAAPLLLLGSPLVPLLWGLPQTERRGLGRLLKPNGPLHVLFHRLTDPVVSNSLFVLTFAVWHIPALYDAAQGRTLLHDLEHTAFFGTALLFWWPVVHPTGGMRRLHHAAAILYFVPAMLEGTLIGALLTFAPSAIYTTFRTAPRLTSLSALDDQQLAGLIMWIPSGLVYTCAILVQVALLCASEERADGNEQRVHAPNTHQLQPH